MSDTVQSKTVVLSALFTQHRDTAGLHPAVSCRLFMFPLLFYFIVTGKSSLFFYFEKYEGWKGLGARGVLPKPDTPIIGVSPHVR